MAKIMADSDAARDRIRLISDYDTHIKALIYGDPGSGKTRLAATAPKPVILLTEFSTSEPTLKQLRRDTGIDVPIMPIENWSMLADAYAYLRYEKHGFETVVLDSLLDMLRRLIEAVIGDAKAKRASHDPDILEQGDWNRVSEKMRSAVRMFRDLPMHVVMTTLVMDDKQESQYIPYLQPKSFARELPSFFNLVGHLSVQEDDGAYIRKLKVSPDNTFWAKNPGGSLPNIVQNPNMTEIFNQVIGFLKED